MAEAYILNHVLTLKIEAIQTEHQDQGAWPTRTSHSGKGGVRSPYSYLNLVARSWSAMARQGLHVDSVKIIIILCSAPPGIYFLLVMKF